MKKLLALAMFGLFCCAFMGASCPNQPGQLDAASIKGEDKDLYMEAEALFEAGDYEGAIKKYQSVVEQFPLSTWANKADFRIGQCYLKLGEEEKAREEFDRFVKNNRDDSEVTVAQDYLIQLTQKDLAATIREHEANIVGYETQNYRLEVLNRYLRKSVDSEVVYIELDLENNRLFVKLGTQSLYEYPIVSGKGYRRLKTTGSVKNFNTPKGIRQIENIIKDPVWYRPNWYWLEKGEELPEDLTMQDRAVHGTLGPYKLGFGEGFYIHGTRSGRIRPGKYSHGCVRMNNKDLKQLVHFVEVGTMLYLY